MTCSRRCRDILQTSDDMQFSRCRLISRPCHAGMRTKWSKRQNVFAYCVFFPLKPQLLAHCCIFLEVEAIFFWQGRGGFSSTLMEIKRALSRFFGVGCLSVAQVQHPASALARRKQRKVWRKAGSMEADTTVQGGSGVSGGGGGSGLYFLGCTTLRLGGDKQTVGGRLRSKGLTRL